MKFQSDRQRRTRKCDRTKGKAIVAIALMAILVFGSGLALLPVPPAWAAFPGTNGQIAYVDVHEEIYRMTPGVGNARLTDNTVSDADPAWSPDGLKITFVRMVGTNFEIFVMNADGSDQTQLTDNTFNDRYPAWSRDGSKIVFCSARDGDDLDIWVMDANGSNQAQITPNNDLPETMPAWAPAGNDDIVYDRFDGDFEISIMVYDGSSGTDLTNNDASDNAPNWSPDGHWITFMSDRTGGWEIFKMTRDGNDVTQLTNNANTIVDENPAWSPDGTKIVFDRFEAGAYTLFMMNSDGSAEESLTVHGQDPDWGPAPITPSLGVTFNPPVVDIGTGGTATITATITPNVAGKTILLSYRKDPTTSWTPIGSDTTDAAGQVSITWTPPETGTYYFRADIADLALTATSDPASLIAIPEFPLWLAPMLLILSLATVTVLLRKGCRRQDSL